MNEYEAKCREAFNYSQRALPLLKEFREKCREVLMQRMFLVKAADAANDCAGFYPIKDYRRKWEPGTAFPDVRHMIELCWTLLRELESNIKFFEQFQSACVDSGLYRVWEKETSSSEQAP